MNEENNDAFSRTLGTEDGPWHEYNLQMASEVLAKFTPFDWENLAHIIVKKPAYWRVRCAEAIGWLDNSDGVQVLLALLNSGDMSVSAIAASELDSMEISLPRSCENTLRELAIYLGAIQSPRVEDVLRLVGNLRAV